MREMLILTQYVNFCFQKIPKFWNNRGIHIMNFNLFINWRMQIP